QLAADNFVFGFGVAADLDLFDVGFLALFNLEVEVHGASLGVGNTHHIEIPGGASHIDITFGPVEILNVFGIDFQALGSKDITDIHAQTIRAGLAPLAFHCPNNAQAVGNIG